MQQGLLDPDEPHPVRVLREVGTSDLFLTGDHAGRAIPRRLHQLGVPDRDLERHIAWDIGIGGVTERLSAMLDATAILQTYSRLVIDCNRNPVWPSAMPEISEFTRIPGNEGLTDADRAARVDAIFAPYHNGIRALLDTRKAAGRRTLFVAMHSFTPSFKGERRDMQVGVLFHNDVRMAAVMLDLLRAERGLIVGENEPYALTDDSDYSEPAHAKGRGLVHVEVEIRQDLIADEAGQVEWASRFAGWLTAADARLRDGGI